MNEHQERLLLPFGCKENWLLSDLVRENEASKDAYALYLSTCSVLTLCRHARENRGLCVCARVCVSPSLRHACAHMMHVCVLCVQVRLCVKFVRKLRLRK